MSLAIVCDECGRQVLIAASPRTGIAQDVQEKLKRWSSVSSDYVSHYAYQEQRGAVTKPGVSVMAWAEQHHCPACTRLIAAEEKEKEAEKLARQKAQEAAQQWPLQRREQGEEEG